MDKQKYQDFLRQIRQCQQRSQRTLNSVDSTLLGVQQTLKDISQTHKNIDKIKEDFSSVMTKLAENVAKSFIVNEQPFKKKEGVIYENLPKEISQKEAVQQMIKNKKILILTGAGVSVDSGIPTFRGINGLYSKNFQHQGQSFTPQQFITLLNYKKHPQGIWKWVDEIYNLSSKTKPNQVHRQIHQLACKLTSKGYEVVLVTQNIDDLHIKPLNNQYEYYAIHGNCKLVRCSNHHFAPYSIQTKNERCFQCNEPYRPHVLFFDQSYGLNYGDKVKQREFPFVITIGSSLKTGLAIKIISKANQVIQINPEPVIQIGKIYHFKNDTVKVLKNLNQALNTI